MTDEIKPLSFKEKWEQERLLKRAKKKAKKELVSKGFGRKEASSAVKKAVNQIAKKPERKSAGRGR